MAEAQQFVWGGPEAAGVPALRARLQEALAWGAALDAAMQAKPTLEALEPLLAWQPPPVAHPGARLHTSQPDYHHESCAWHSMSRRPSLDSLASPLSTATTLLTATSPLRAVGPSRPHNLHCSFGTATGGGEAGARLAGAGGGADCRRCGAAGAGGAGRRGWCEAKRCPAIACLCQHVGRRCLCMYHTSVAQQPYVCVMTRAAGVSILPTPTPCSDDNSVVLQLAAA